MKTMQFILSIFFSIFIFFSCSDNGTNIVKTDVHVDHYAVQADSLANAIMGLHDESMTLFDSLKKLRTMVNEKIDTLNEKMNKNPKLKIPKYKAGLDYANNKITTALNEMSDWMDQIKIDSAHNQPEKRVKYLQQQVGKMYEIKFAMESSLRFADSILRKKI